HRRPLPRPAGRDRVGGAGLRPATASLHRQPDRLRTRPRPAPPPRRPGDPGRDPGPAAPPQGLRLPHPLPAGRGPLPQRNPRLARDRPRPVPALPPCRARHNREDTDMNWSTDRRGFLAAGGAFLAALSSAPKLAWAADGSTLRIRV